MDPTLIPQSFLSRKEESFDQSKTQQSFKGLFKRQLKAAKAAHVGFTRFTPP